MPRTWSTDLQTIHQSYRRRDTLDLYLNDNSVLRLSRGQVTRIISGSPVVYDNYIRSVDQLRTSLDAGVDRITINCQNVNSLLGFNLASNLRLLDYAIGDYGKIYQSLRNPSLKEDIPQFFRGVLANAEAGEETISFEFIVDYESLGAIIAARALSSRCWWKNQNGIECQATDVCSQTKFTCKSLKDFGGFEFFEEPASNLPGDGGNDGGGIGTGECFSGRMRVRTPDGDFSFVDLYERFKEGKKSIITPDRFTGELQEDEIEKFFVHEQTGFFTLTFDHATLEVTNEHPFLIDFGVLLAADRFVRGETTTKALNGSTWFDSMLRHSKWNSETTEKFYCCKTKKNGMLIVENCAVSNRSADPNF